MLRLLQVNAKKRQHAIRKLAKAAHWAAHLAALAGVRADDRTCAEAEAYAAWLAGLQHQEQHRRWRAAQAQFEKAQ